MDSQARYQPNRYLELDALRGIAALLVVFFHLTLNRPGDNTILKLGTTGVDLFFIISGFVIFMSLHKIKTGREFVANRIARLYPTYWAAVTFTFLLLAAIFMVYKPNAMGWQQVERYLANLTMFQLYLGESDLDSTYWTLLVEMLFYIFMLLLFKLGLLRYVNAIGLSIIIATVIAVQYYHVPIIQTTIKYVPLLSFLPLFLVGINFYRIYTSAENSYKDYIIPVICLVCQVLLFRYGGRSRFYININEYILMLALYFVVFTAFANNSLGFIVNKVTLFFGRISYALYAVHMFISVKVLLPVFVENNFNFWLSALFIILPVIVILATAITYFIEIPLRYRIKKALSPAYVPDEENKPKC